ncbi:MAG: copper chaperone PCu(A)C [Alphaproteobacteria bacterium]|nr:copper chaperone PCu(A)C [Alphaproteobacteria bacterium]
MRSTTLPYQAATAATLALIGLLAVGIYLIGLAPQAKAQSVKAGDLMIEQAWARATPPGARVGGGYLTITNHGAAPDRLIGGSVDFAERLEIHEMAMQGEVMKMRALPDGLEIPPGGAVTLKPGGYHLMFMGLKNALEQGARVPVTLAFERAGRVTVDLAVAGMGAKSHDGQGAHGGHGGHGGHGETKMQHNMQQQ